MSLEWVDVVFGWVDVALGWVDVALGWVDAAFDCVDVALGWVNAALHCVECLSPFKRNIDTKQMPRCALHPSMLTPASAKPPDKVPLHPVKCDP